MTTDHLIEDIYAEHMMGHNLRQADLDRFAAAGVPPLALIHDGIVLRQRVAFCTGGRFEFERRRGSDENVWAFLIPCHDDFGELVDLVAWRPPSVAATWLGRVGMLGQEQVLGPRFEPLLVHENLMDWLRADRAGVVVVDMKRAASLLRSAGPLMVRTVEHGQRLRQSLAVPAPRIVVQVDAAEGAAA